MRTQPCSKAFVPPGKQAVFPVAAHYQWTKIGECLTNDDRKRGTLSPTFTISKAHKKDEGKYICRITGENDSEFIKSSEVQLVVSKLFIISHCMFLRWQYYM